MECLLFFCPAQLRIRREASFINSFIRNLNDIPITKAVDSIDSLINFFFGSDCIGNSTKRLYFLLKLVSTLLTILCGRIMLQALLLPWLTLTEMKTRMKIEEQETFFLMDQL